MVCRLQAEPRRIRTAQFPEQAQTAATQSARWHGAITFGGAAFDDGLGEAPFHVLNSAGCRCALAVAGGARCRR